MTKNTATAPAAIAAPGNCPAIPAKESIARTIKAAMFQIYGPDEASAQFAVSAVTAGADCRHLNFAYFTGAARAHPAAATLEYGPDANWYLTLYNKRFAVQ